MGILLIFSIYQKHKLNVFKEGINLQVLINKNLFMIDIACPETIDEIQQITYHVDHRTGEIFDNQKYEECLLTHGNDATRYWAENNILMITSPSPGVGKSFLSVNLAVVLAEAGKKVLLIDGDIRKGSLHNVLGVNKENGLTELLLMHYQ